MASFKDLEMDWSMLCQDPECWSESDLQLAAELGKTLLERNKELENALKQHQSIIEDQAQEIEYLTKQSAALREGNESRLRIYEQLEVGIQDLERAKHRLELDNSTQKKHVKSLTATIENLEIKNDELLATIDRLNSQVETLKKKVQSVPDDVQQSRITPAKLRHVDQLRDDVVDSSEPTRAIHIDKVECRGQNQQNKTDRISNDSKPSPENEEAQSKNMEEMAQLMAQVRELRTQFNREQRKVVDLEEQLSMVLQQNQALENQIIKLHHRDEEMKSMHEELNTLEEVKQGQLCSKCLRNMDKSTDNIPDDDDSSMLEELMSTSQHRTSYSLDVQEPQDNFTSPVIKQQSMNVYKELIEKYEALFANHHHPTPPRKEQGMSLQEEMQLSGDFNNINVKDTDEESGHGDSLKPEVQRKPRKTISHTPTDFSEAETSSSGFSDETSTKATQTENKVGSFLCTIADGEDCKFSIYDDASPIDSRFRNRPEYRELFKEIFTVLKKAAETKEEGEELPRLDDQTPNRLTPKVPPVTPLNDDIPDYPDDDTRSYVSSTISELSISQNEPTTIIEDIIQSQNQPIPEVEIDEKQKEPVLRPLIRQPLEYLSIETRKRSSSRRKNKFSERSDSPVTHIIGSPKISYTNRPNSGRRRREMKHSNVNQEQTIAYDGSTLQFWSSSCRNVASPTPSQGSGKAIFEFKPSSATQDLHKLKKLDRSYAEVLRMGEGRKREQNRHRRK